MKIIILTTLAALTLLTTPQARAWTYHDGDVLLVFRQGFGSCDCRGVIGRRRFRRQSMNDEVLRRAAAEAQSKCEDHVEDSH